MPLDSKQCQSCETNVFLDSDCCMFIENIPLCLKCFYKNSVIIQDNPMNEDMPTNSLLCRNHKLSSDIFCHTCQSQICYKCLLIHRSHETEDLCRLQPKNMEKVKLFIKRCESLQDTLNLIENHIKLHEKHANISLDLSSFEENLISHYFNSYSSDINKEAASNMEKIKKSFTAQLSEEMTNVVRDSNELKLLISQDIPDATEQTRSLLFIKSTWEKLGMSLIFLSRLT